MTHLIHYWQRLTHRPGDQDDATEAPVLDLAACFAKPTIAARRPGDVMRLVDVTRALPTPR